MFRKMRRKKQELTEKQCLDILRRAKTATLALSGMMVILIQYRCILFMNIEKSIFMVLKKDIK